MHLTLNAINAEVIMSL